LKITKPAAFAAADPALQILHSNGATLIEWDALPRVFQHVEEENEEPDFAIENFSIDYDTEGNPEE